jgi:hypothetical protein
LNISEIVAQKHLLARITALELAVATLEQRENLRLLEPEAVPLSKEQIGSSVAELAQYLGMKRKPGRPRKNA